jgi:hypothetical protein
MNSISLCEHFLFIDLFRNSLKFFCGSRSGKIRLYPICVGRVTLDKSTLTAGRGMGTRITVPVPVFFIKHPKGNILCDTGMRRQIAVDPAGCWGEAKVKNLTPDVKPDEEVIPGIVWNPDQAISSIRKLRYLRDKKSAFIITGHDPVLWSKLKKAPDYYS